MNKKAFVAVLGKDGLPLMPCSGKRARQLLDRKQARVVRIKPFVIQMLNRDRGNSVVQDMTVKIDPGSKSTGIAVARISSHRTLYVTNLIELEHRGWQITAQLKARAALRRNRRSRNTRYRPMRFLNRTKSKGWLPPSLMHRVTTTISWLKRLIRWYPITELALERVKFDTQKMQNDAVAGKEYQRGDLYEREIMEYLLEKYHHTCVYCDTKTAKFNKDHVIPKSRGGSNRISNLVLSCQPCNQAKNSLPIEIFLMHDQERLKKIVEQLKAPLKDAAVMNSTRNRIFSEMLKLGLPVETGTGAQTKLNRNNLKIRKTHALDAVCVGNVKELHNWDRPHASIRCRGRGQYRRTNTDKHGFPRTICRRIKRVLGFATGDLVKAFQPRTGRSSFGRLTTNGICFMVVDAQGKAMSAYSRWIKLLQKGDGYEYQRNFYK